MEKRSDHGILRETSDMNPATSGIVVEVIEVV
jgi:hypothetical protein